MTAGDIVFLRDQAARQMLADSKFLGEWQQLSAACPWATPFQSVAFARCWYAAYAKTFEPLLAIARGADGQLVGMFPLAIARDGSRTLIAAGDDQAEYQGWINHPSLADEFIANAIRAIRSSFPRHSLKLHFLTPGISTKWLEADASLRGRFALTARPRPIMRFGDGSAVKTSIAKKNNKSRWRALKKLGDVEFKKLTSPAEVEAIFGSLALAHDARRIAVNNVAPFEDDAARRPFYLAMTGEPGLIHATALMAGSQVASAQLNYVYGDHVQLGLISYNPLLAEYSPGKMHILMLAKMLHEEGFSFLDITPGDDGYKQRFANDADEVQSLTIYPTTHTRARRQFAESAHRCVKNALMQRDILPARAEAAVRNFVRQGILGMPITAGRALARCAHSTTQLEFYSLPVAAAGALSSSIAVERDSLEALYLFRECSRAMSRQKFLRAAFDRSEEVFHVYTHVDAGQLRFAGWIAEKTSQIKSLSMLQLAKGIALVVDVQSFGDASNLQQFTTALISAAATGKDVHTVIVQVPAGDARLRAVVELIGMKRDCMLTTRWRFGRKQNVATRWDGSVIQPVTKPPRDTIDGEE